MKPQKWIQLLYIQVLISIAIGIALGHFYPAIAVQMKPLGDAFIKLTRMMIGGIIFTTVVTGIAKMKNSHEVRRIGFKALVYFEVITTFALLLGLVVAHFYQPGAGMNVDPQTLTHSALPPTPPLHAVEFLLNIIPATLVSAFTNSDLLPVLVVSILVGFALLQGGEKLKPLYTLVDLSSDLLFRIVDFIIKLAPIGAFGAMAYTIGEYGIHTLVSLCHLLLSVYVTCILFVFVVLGTIAKISGFSLWKFLVYIKEELLIVLGTSSSEAVLPRMVEKLENLGCGNTVVGLVLPAGYSFNLDGTSIYLTIASLYIAQALNIHLTAWDIVTMILIFIVASKGAAAISGGGFIVLTATLSSMHTIPVEGMVLLLGIDKFLGEARALTNLIGNGVATVVIAKWEGDFDAAQANKVLNS